MLYETIVVKNFAENTTTIYYASNHTAACEWKRSVEADVEASVEGAYYTIEWGDDEELAALSGSGEYVRPYGAPYGIYTREY